MPQSHQVSNGTTVTISSCVPIILCAVLAYEDLLGEQSDVYKNFQPDMWKHFSFPGLRNVTGQTSDGQDRYTSMPLYYTYCSAFKFLFVFLFKKIITINTVPWSCYPGIIPTWGFDIVTYLDSSVTKNASHNDIVNFFVGSTETTYITVQCGRSV